MKFEPKFKFGRVVTIEESGEQGTVIGCAFYPIDEDRYLIRYKNGAGNCVEIWWTKSTLKEA